MEKVFVDLGENSYDILIHDSFGELINALKGINAPKKLLIVTDTNVDKLYGDEVLKLLQSGGYDAAKYVFAAGEEHKNMDAILGICRACIDNKLDRKSMIVALGGGVVGDMAGFAAAIYMRGIPFVQIPTTLLSQSDSSVGGKTGVDFAGSKNILGAFWQPKLVYMNVSTLKTLPKEQFVSGMGEVIKHGIIRDRSFYSYLKTNAEKIKSLDSETLIKMDKINCMIKADVVMQDEKENGLRAILNFGHTIGHAAESAYNFRKTHGECVGLGMIAAFYIARKRNMITDTDFADVEKILLSYGFEICADIPDNDIVYAYMMNDKKKVQNTLKFVLPVSIGEVVQKEDVSKEEIYEAIDYIRR